MEPRRFDLRGNNFPSLSQGGQGQGQGQIQDEFGIRYTSILKKGK